MPTGRITLEEIRTAIRTVLKHQSYEMMDRRFTFANLAELRKMEQDAIAEQNARNNRQWRPIRFQPVG